MTADNRTCAFPGDQEHDHAMCEDAVLEAAAAQAATNPGYAGRDLQAVFELEAIVGYLANYVFHATNAAEVPDPDRYDGLTCDGLLRWLGDLAVHMKTERLTFVELHLRLASEARQQRNWTAESVEDTPQGDAEAVER